MGTDRTLRHLFATAVGVGAHVVASWTIAAAAQPTQRPAALTVDARASTAPQRYAASLFDSIALPPGATRISTPIAPLRPVTGSPGFVRLTTVVRYYDVAPSIDVISFAKSRFPATEWEGTGTTYDGYHHSSVAFAALPLCPDRHVAYCSVTYSVRPLLEHRQELRVDVALVWLPVVVVRLPASGVVTVTGFDSISLLHASSGAVRVTLTGAQVDALRKAVASLRRSPGGECMEDSLLYRITVATTAGGRVIWSASADECPGVLTVASNAPPVSLNDRSCPLDRLVSTFFGPTQATGTRAGLRHCQPS